METQQGDRNSTQKYYDDFSDWYERERHHGYHAMLDALEEKALAQLIAGRDVLEVGCGTGLIMRRLTDRARRVVGVDLSRGMLITARERQLEVSHACAESLPFMAESFDTVYSLKVLAHVRDIEAALAEMARVLKPGGCLAAEFYNRHSLRYLAKLLGGPGKISEQRTEAEVFTRWDSPAEIVRLLPPCLKFVRWHGVRVFTPAAAAFRVPLAGAVLPWLESKVLSSPAARFGGFLIAECQKL